MNTSQAFIELVRKRTSIRKYSDQSFEAQEFKEILNLFKELETGLFGSKIRYKLISNLDEQAETRFGTYGFISGAQYYIAGAVNQNPMAFIDFGYNTEKLILALTGLNLVTCWLGGTFSRGQFAEEINLQENELLPCITPVGYATESRGLREKLIRFGAKSDTRLPFETLFLNTETNTISDDFIQMLECVRMAPSASNKQPWRLVVTDNQFGFYLKRTAGYGKFTPGNDLQQVDMGIALAHFTGAAEAFGYTFTISNGSNMEILPEMEAVAEVVLSK